MAAGGTEVLETDVERTDVFENGVLRSRVDERNVLAIDHGTTDEAARSTERADTLPVPRGEKAFPDGQAGSSEDLDASDATPDGAGVAGGAASAEPVDIGVQAPPTQKARNDQPWSAKLTMLLVAVVALVGLVALAVAITREVTAGDSSDDISDIGYSYLCDTVTGSDPGVYGVGHCRASGGLQASGMIPVGQSYVLTPRSANALGYKQSFSCSGGRASSPSMVIPKRCAAIGNPVPASH